jgi:hypothetical protein
MDVKFFRTKKKEEFKFLLIKKIILFFLVCLFAGHKTTINKRNN